MVDAGDAEEKQVVCRFVTKLPDKYRVPEDPIALPASVTRLGLSRVINHLLALEEHQPFDFLIHSELLRDTLGEFLEKREISAEATLDIEYTPLLGPPEERSSVPHDDWVSCVTSVGATRKSGGGAASGDYIVSGSYDGSLHVFHKATGALKSTSSVVAHPGGTTAVSAGGKHVFSGGKDGAVRMWTATEGQLSSKAVFHGHTDAVQSVCPAPDGSLVCSGAWDCSVRVWAAGDSALKAAAAEAEARTDAAGPRKRRTGGGVEVAVHETVVEFSAHTQCVSSLCWPVAESLVSGSWDHTVRIWDMHERKCRDTLTSSKAVLCVAPRPSDDRCITAFGGADKAWRLWDPLSKGVDGGVVIKAFSSHRGWVSSIAWHPTDPNVLVTTSYDGSAKVWDIRGTVPLHSIQLHADKVLCSSWADAKNLVTGGADSRLVMMGMPEGIA